MRTRPDELTLREALACFGLGNYAATISGFDKSSVYHVYKFFRRRAAAAAPLDGPANIWPSIVKRWAGWLASEAQATPRVITVLHATKPNTLYTDACESGMGAILFHADGLVSVWARPFVGEERRHHINVKEAIALHDALETMDWSGPINVLVDNTTVLKGGQ